MSVVAWPRLLLAIAGVFSSSKGGSHVRITNTLSLPVSGEGLGKQRARRERSQNNMESSAMADTLKEWNGESM